MLSTWSSTKTSDLGAVLDRTKALRLLTQATIRAGRARLSAHVDLVCARPCCRGLRAPRLAGIGGSPGEPKPAGEATRTPCASLVGTQ